MRYVFVTSVVLLCTVTFVARAGFHLGMKSVCKRYGQAWNSGSKVALAGVTTRDFYRQWERMPTKAFGRLPRGGSARVLSSSKGYGTGQVTVATPRGVVSLVLVGRGFDWRVDDIYKASRDGRTVSVKSYLDATLTSREFMKDLKKIGGTSFHDSISKQFRLRFEELSQAELDRVRRFLPDVTKVPKPDVELGSKQASVRVHLWKADPEGSITFRLVRQSGWKVDDFTIQRKRTKIASFGRSLPLIASASALGQFIREPQSIDPASFTAEGPFRQALVQARNETPFPLKKSGKREEFIVGEDFRSVRIRYPDRQVRIQLTEESGRLLIENVSVRTGQRWTDVASLLAIKRRLRTFWISQKRDQAPTPPSGQVSLFEGEKK